MPKRKLPPESVVPNDPPTDVGITPDIWITDREAMKLLSVKRPETLMSWERQGFVPPSAQMGAQRRRSRNALIVALHQAALRNAVKADQAAEALS